MVGLGTLVLVTLGAGLALAVSGLQTTLAHQLVYVQASILRLSPIEPADISTLPPKIYSWLSCGVRGVIVVDFRFSKLTICGADGCGYLGYFHSIHDENPNPFRRLRAPCAWVCEPVSKLVAFSGMAADHI